MSKPKLEYRTKKLYNYYDNTAEGWIKFFEQCKLDHIEYEQYDKVTYHIEKEYYYGDEYAALFMHYYSPETEEEKEQRLEYEKSQKEWRKKQFEQLKKEFGN